MSPRFLNVIIALSIIGIAGILLKERFFSAPTAASQVVSAQARVEITPSTAPDPLIPCQSSYFNFQKGTSWKYKLSAGTTFISTIVENASSSATISTKIASAKEPIVSKLTCKQSGIYGLPFIPITSKSIPPSLMNSLLFLPPDVQITKGSVWESPINIGVQIPFTSKGIAISSTVRKVTENSVTVGSTINVGSGLLPENIVPNKNGDILEYTLTKDLGVSAMTVAGITATLTEFNP